jgi:hypothetical protein
MKSLIFMSMITTVVVSVIGCGESEEVKAQKAAQALAAKAEEKRKGFHCLSGWDGTHRGTEKYVLAGLRDPDSYQHIETRITPVKNGKHTLVMQYRAKNGFGGYVPGTVVVEVNNKDCSGTVVGSL